MRFAIVNGERQEAQKGTIGLCICCNSPMVAKCGAKKLHHWSHKGKLDCDPWWENETEWHRNWKSQFPKDWQEIVHKGDNGEIHRADVKTEHGWVLEFQFSKIEPRERKERTGFYKKIIWVVYGPKRKKDPARFFSSLKAGQPFEDPFILRAFDVSSSGSELVRDWENENVPVFFDFNEPNILWSLLPRNPQSKQVVVAFSRQKFIEIHLATNPEDKFTEIFQFLGIPNSAEDIFLKFHFKKREDERRKLLLAENARMASPYINRRSLTDRRF